MDASGGVISNSINGQGNAFVGIGYTLDENNKIIPVADAILGTYKITLCKQQSFPQTAVL